MTTYFISQDEAHQEEWGDGDWHGNIFGDGYVAMGDTEGGNEDSDEDEFHGDGDGYADNLGGGNSWPSEDEL